MGLFAGMLLDKMADNVVVTSGTIAAPVGATFMTMLPTEVTVGVMIALGIAVRMVIESMWHRHNVHRVERAHRLGGVPPRRDGTHPKSKSRIRPA